MRVQFLKTVGVLFNFLVVFEADQGVILIDILKTTMQSFGPSKNLFEYGNCTLNIQQQNRNFCPKGEGRSGRRPLLPKRKHNILVDLSWENHTILS